MKRRIYRDGVPQHVFLRGKGSGIIFYCLQDCIYFITLYTCMAEKYGIVTSAFTLMPNHTHAQQTAQTRSKFIAFNRDLSISFTKSYNIQHGRSGELFDNPFGSYPKSTGKLIKANLSYICNNGAEGKLSTSVLDYRWNFMAYFRNPAPFSERIRRDRVQKKLLDAVRMVDYYRKNRIPLSYHLQERLYQGLDMNGRSRLTDRNQKVKSLRGYGNADYLAKSAVFCIARHDGWEGETYILLLQVEG